MSPYWNLPFHRDNSNYPVTSNQFLEWSAITRLASGLKRHTTSFHSLITLCGEYEQGNQRYTGCLHHCTYRMPCCYWAHNWDACHHKLSSLKHGTFFPQSTWLQSLKAIKSSFTKQNYNKLKEKTKSSSLQNETFTDFKKAKLSTLLKLSFQKDKCFKFLILTGYIFLIINYFNFITTSS